MLFLVSQDICGFNTLVSTSYKAYSFHFVTWFVKDVVGLKRTASTVL